MPLKIVGITIFTIQTTTNPTHVEDFKFAVPSNRTWNSHGHEGIVDMIDFDLVFSTKTSFFVWVTHGYCDLNV